MKKFRILMGALALAMVAATVIACTKEKETVFRVNDQVEINNPQNDAEVKRILNFKKQVETRKANPGTKSAETVTLDEAMNNIVDLFNVTYTEPMAYYTESERHYFTVSVALTADGSVLVGDVVSAYGQALAHAREAYHASTLPDKAYQRLMVTCTPQRDGTVDLMFDGKYGTKTDQPEPEPPTPNPHHPGPFRQGDDWHFIEGMGRCDGTCLDEGANRVLQDTLMEEVRALWPIPYDGGRGVFTHLVEIEFAPEPPVTHNVFYRTDIDNTCIELQEMNDLLHHERKLAFEVLPSESDDPVIVLQPTSAYNYRDYVTDITIDGDMNLGLYPYIRHKTTVEYGRYLCIDDVIDFNDL